MLCMFDAIIYVLPCRLLLWLVIQWFIEASWYYPFSWQTMHAYSYVILSSVVFFLSQYLFIFSLFFLLFCSFIVITFLLFFTSLSYLICMKRLLILVLAYEINYFIFNKSSLIYMPCKIISFTSEFLHFFSDSSNV